MKLHLALGSDLLTEIAEEFILRSLEVELLDDDISAVSLGI